MGGMPVVVVVVPVLVEEVDVVPPLPVAPLPPGPPLLSIDPVHPTEPIASAQAIGARRQEKRVPEIRSSADRRRDAFIEAPSVQNGRGNRPNRETWDVELS